MEFSNPSIQLKLTLSKDGSHTLYREDIDEHYHSTYGAIQEAMHVFIEKGLKEFNRPITILEVGFGTGLNALLTCLNADNSVKYIGVEAFPVKTAIINQLNYTKEVEGSTELFKAIHSSSWNKESSISGLFSLLKVEATIQSYTFDTKIDLIYFDAFGPNSQAEMWDIAIFKKLYNAMSSEGIFVTYCAKGQVRRDLQNAGFIIERLEGPPGKREMLRATKP